MPSSVLMYTRQAADACNILMKTTAVRLIAMLSMSF